MNVYVVSDAGDPTNPRTWSGTPSNLIQGFKQIGVDVEGLNVTIPRWIRIGLTGTSVLLGYGRDFRRTWLGNLYASLATRSKGSPDTLFVHTSSSTIPSRGKSRRGLHVLYLDSTFHLMAQHTLMPYSPRQLERYDEFEQKSLKAADFVFPISECGARDVIGHYGISADLVFPAGTGKGSIRASDAERFYDDPTILFVAKQRFEEKGGVLLLNAFRIARESNPNLKLVVVATEPYRAMVEALPGTRFASNLVWDELQGLFNTASVYAMPAIHEPWGLVYIEAMSCGTPILGLDRYAVPEMTGYGEFGFIVSEPTPEAVAVGLVSALSDPVRLKHMGQRARQRVENHYGWEKVASRILTNSYGLG